MSWCRMAVRYWSVYFWLLCFLVVCDRDRMWQSLYSELFMIISIALMSHFPSEVCHNVCIVLRLQVLFSSPLRLFFSLIFLFSLHFHSLFDPLFSLMISTLLSLLPYFLIALLQCLYCLIALYNFLFFFSSRRFTFSVHFVL